MAQAQTEAMIRTTLLLISAVTFPAVAQDSRPTGPLKSTRTKHGDTTIVSTISGSLWGDQLKLVEELRIGTRNADGPDSFGFLRAFAVFPDGVVAVFDQSVPALRLFDPFGKHLRTLGRNGAGPGEYRDDAMGLAVDRHGVLIMYDVRNSRLNRWKESGEVLPAWRWTASSLLYTMTRGLQVDSAGNTYIQITTERPQPGRDLRRGLARLDPTGRLVDTLREPLIDGPDVAPTVPFSPYKYWFLTRTGGAVSAWSGRYAITVSEPGRPPLRIERVTPQVFMLADERRNYQEISDARSGIYRGNQTQPSSTVAQAKPYFSQLHADLDGRLWVQLHVTAVPFAAPAQRLQPGQPQLPPLRWREPVRWDVFQRDGSYLGQLELPSRARLAEAKGDRVWAIESGDDDEQYIVRYRIVH